RVPRRADADGGPATEARAAGARAAVHGRRGPGGDSPGASPAAPRSGAGERWGWRADGVAGRARAVGRAREPLREAARAPGGAGSPPGPRRGRRPGEARDAGVGALARDRLTRDLEAR